MNEKNDYFQLFKLNLIFLNPFQTYTTHKDKIHFFVHKLNLDQNVISCDLFRIFLIFEGKNKAKSWFLFFARKFEYFINLKLLFGQKLDFCFVCNVFIIDKTQKWA